ncbi:MAG: serpin family protein [Planctomycetota bacterium]
MLTDRRTLLKLALFGLACGGSPVRAAGERQTKLSDDVLQAAAETSNLFAADLQKLLGTEGGNLFFSPASISAALAMTAAGAEGETRKEMFSVLHASGESDAWLRGMGGLSRLLNATGEGYTLQMANRLWGQNGFQFRADYLLRMEEQFAAPLGQVDFVGAPEPSREAINAWVAEQTRDRIKDLLPAGSITGLTRLVLTNAIYFKADWRDEFNKKLTQEQPFRCADGKQVTLPLMNLEKSFPYAEDELAQVIDLPYKSGGLSMVVILPKDKGGLSELEQQLTNERLSGWMKQLEPQSTMVFFPKFKLETQFSLAAALKKLGMPRAFDSRAEFGGMSTEAPLNISDVVHKAFVEVDEQGTEAAAATGVIMATRAAPIQREPKVFRADHPFLFLIRHRESGAVLFAGRLSQPK